MHELGKNVSVYSADGERYLKLLFTHSPFGDIKKSTFEIRLKFHTQEEHDEARTLSEIPLLLIDLLIVTLSLLVTYRCSLMP